MERRWGCDLTVFVRRRQFSWSRAVVDALVEQRLSLVPKVQHGVESTGARTACKPAVRLRASHIGLRVVVVTSSESLSKIHSC